MMKRNKLAVFSVLLSVLWSATAVAQGQLNNSGWASNLPTGASNPGFTFPTGNLTPTAPAGNNTTDQSNDSVLVPTNPTGNTPSPVTFQRLGVVKAAGTITQVDPRTFDVPYVIQVRNVGSIPATNINAVDNLAAAFPAAVVTLQVAPSVTTVGAATLAQCALATTPAFNGVGNNALLVGNQTLTANGDGCNIRFTARVQYPTSGQVPTTAQNNTAVATSSAAANPLGTPAATDLRSTDSSTTQTSTGTPIVPSNPPTSGDNPAPTPVTFTPAPVLDVVKTAGAVVPNAGGNPAAFDVPYTVRVANLGTTAVPNVQVTEFLGTTAGSTFVGATSVAIQGTPTQAPINGATCTLNAGFNGSSNTGLLSGTNTLNATQGCTLTFTVRVTYANPGAVPSTNQNNTAFASGGTAAANPGFTFPGGTATAPTGATTTDNSTDSNTLPTTAKGDAPSPTPVSFSSAQIATTKSVGTVTQLSPLSFRVPYTVRVANTGNTALPNIQVNDFLGTGTGGTFATASSIVVQTAPVATGTGTCNANATYNGNANTALLSTTVGSSLAIGQNCVVTFTVDVTYPTAAALTAANPSQNTAWASNLAAGTTSAGYTFPGGTPTVPVGNNTVDQSTNSAAVPTDPGGSTPTPTPLAPQQIDVVKSALAPVQVNSTTFDVPYTVRLGNQSSITATNVQVNDFLGTGTGSTFPTASSVAIQVPATIGAGSAASCVVATPVFNGNANTALLNGTGNLTTGQFCLVTFTARVTYANAAAVPTTVQNNTARASTATGTNAGFTFPGGTPTAPVNVLATDASSTGNALPGTPNGDAPTPTPITFAPNPVIDVVKSDTSVVGVVGNPAAFDVTYAVRVANTGAVNAPNVQINDFLTGVGGTFANGVTTPPTVTIQTAPAIAAGATGTCTANAAYTGAAANSGLLTAGSLTPAQFCVVTFTARVNYGTTANVPSTAQNNTALASNTPGANPGYSNPTTPPATNNALDTSTDVTNAATGGTPTNGGTDAPSPTPVSLVPGQEIGVVKGVGTPVQVSPNVFDIPYAIRVQNTSASVTATNVQVSDNLALTFPSATSRVIQVGPTLDPSGTGTCTIATTPVYNGIGNNNLLTGANSLTAGQFCVIKLTARVTFPVGAIAQQDNTAVATTAATPGGAPITTDNSGVSPLNPQGNPTVVPAIGDPVAPTPIIPVRQVIATTKSVGTVTALSPKSFTVPYTVRVANTATVDATNVQVNDLLGIGTGSTFNGASSVAISAYTITPGSGAVAGDCAAATPAFDGVTNTAMLAGNTTLAPNENCVISFTATVTYPTAASVPTAPQNNSAFASTAPAANPTGFTYPGGVPTAPATALSTDQSNDGTAVPTTPTGSTPTPTPLPVPQTVDVVKSDSSTVVIAGNPAAFDVTYAIRVANTGAINATNVQVNDLLTGTGGTFANGVTTPPAVTIQTAPAIGAGSAASCAVNGGYNGAANSALLNGTGTLTPAQFCVVTFTTRVDYGTTANVPSNAQNNTAFASTLGAANANGFTYPGGVATPPAGALETDTSTDVTNAVAGGTPTDGGTDAPSPTPVSLVPGQQIGVVKGVGTPVQVSPNVFDIPYALQVSNTGVVAATNVQVSDNLAATFPTATSIVIQGTPTSTGTGAPTAATAAQCALNASFTGQAANTNLLAGDQTLNTQATTNQGCIVKFVARVTFPVGPIAQQNNTAVATTAATPGGAPITTDNSTSSPLDPISGNPTVVPTPTDAPSPTPITPARQQIDVVKSAGTITQTGATPAEQARTFLVPYTLQLINRATVAATNVQVVDNLAATFSGATVTISTAAATAPVGGATAAQCAVATPAFNGTGNNNLLVGTQSLATDQGCTITFTARVEYPTSGQVPTTAQNNTAVANTATGTGTTLATDSSTSSATPPTAGNPNTDVPSPTPVTFTPAPVLDVVKTAGAVVPNAGGNPAAFDVPYTVRVANLGTTAVPNVQVTEFLGTTAGSTFVGATSVAIQGTPTQAPINGATCTLNAGFNGSSNTGLLSGTNTLNATQGCTLAFTVRVTYANPGAVPNTSQNNTAFASGGTAAANPGFTFPGGTATAPTGATTTDNSTDSNTLPTTAKGDTPSPTPVSFSSEQVAVTKSAGAPVQTGPLTFQVPYTVRVANTGNSILSNVQVSDNLSSAGGTYAGATVAVSGITSSGTGTCTANAGFNGGSDKSLLTSGVLAVGQNCVVGFTATVTYPNVAAASGTKNNAALASNTTTANNPGHSFDPITGAPTPPTNSNTTDVSTDSTTVPTSPAGSTPTPTVTTPQEIDAVKGVGTPTQVGTNQFDIPYSVQINNTGTVPATNVQIVENLSNTFPTATAIAIQGTPTTAGVSGATAAQCALNATFTGQTANTALLAGTQTLNATQGCIVKFVARVTFPTGAIAAQNNTAVATTAQNPNPNGTNPPLATDNSSVTPLDPISGNPTTPPAAGDTPSPTPVTPVRQQLEVVKAAPSVVQPVVGNPLAFDVPYAVQISNTGTVPATNVQAVDDLALTYPAPAVVTIQTAAAVTTGTCTLNATTYNGTSQAALLSGSNTLAPAATCIVKFVARVTYPSAAAIPTTAQNNTAVATTDDVPNPNGTNPTPITTDNSTTTTPNGSGDPTTPPVAGDTPTPTPTRLNQPPVTQDRTNDAIGLTANATVLSVTPPAGSPNLLGTDPNGTVTGYRITSLPTNGTLALGGTPVAINDIVPVAQLGTLTFDPDGTAPVSGSTSFNYAAIDNDNLEDGTPNAYSIPLGNNPPTTDNHTNVPVNAAGANAPLALNPVAPVLTGADSDGTVDNFVVTTLPTVGTLLFNGNPVVAGTTLIPNTPAGLALVTYTPSATQPVGNSTTFQYAARDNNGLLDGSPATFTIPYNQPPVTQDLTNDPLVLTANATVLNPNLLGTDPDGTVTGYRITSLPTNGTLVFGAANTPVTLNQIIPASSLADLKFDPDGTAPVSGSTSFNYAAIDNNNLEDASPATYIIPLGNLPPTTDDHTNVPVNAGEAAAPIALNPVAPALTGTDPDGTVAGFVVTTLPTTGTLTYNGAPIVAGTTVIPNTPADLALVRYLPSTTQPTAPVTFTYAARDNNGLQDGSPATFTIPYNVQNIDAVKTSGATTVLSATSYSVPITIRVGNTGTIPATKVQVVENLTRTFQGATSIAVSSLVVTPSAGASCTAAIPAFNGTGNNALLAGSDTLQPGQNCTITFTVTVVFPDVPTATATRNNQVYASTSAQPGNNPGHTVPNDPAQPVVPPVGALATDSSTNSPNLPVVPNSDPPSPTPITPTALGTLNGLVFEDKNSNGLQDAGELGIGNVPVTITPSTGAPIVVNTNPDGTYSVPNLPLGSTTAAVTDPANSRLTTANDPQNVVIVPGTNTATNVGFVFLGNVKGNVFVDANGNGSQAGATETGFAAQVTLTNGSFSITVPTDPTTGVYTADNVPVGTVTVTVVNSSIPATLTTGGVPNQTAGVNPSAVTVTTANTPANRADAGADGFQPNPPVAVNDTTTTASDTNVDIPVLTNDSTTVPNTKDPTSVVFTPTGQPAGSTLSPDGKTLTVPNEGTYTINPTTGVVTFDPLPTLNGSTTPVQYTFNDNGGLSSNPALISVSVGAPTKGTVTGLVFRDDNGNGTKDPTEPGIGGVDVIVTPVVGAAVTVVTNADGTWSAPGVPAGNATVKVQTTDTDFPVGATLTTTGSDPSNVIVIAGGTVADAQDGFRLPAPATVADTANTPNNTPVNNLPILGNDTSSSPLTLNPASVVFQGGGTITNAGKTLTNPQGVYTINPDGTVNFVPASPAVVGVLTPVQYTVADSSGNVSAPTNITITVGAIGIGSLNGIVFFDDNGNGARDGSETGIPNVQVTLTPVGGGAAIPVTTDSNGAYSANVPAGAYVVQIINSSLPANVKTGTVPNQTAGNNDPANPINTTTVVGGATSQANPDGYRINPPVASNDSSSTPVNTPVPLTLTGNDNATSPANIVPSTVDLDPSTPIQDPSRTVPQGTFALNGIGEVIFTPNTNFSGTVTPITYTVKDSIGQTSNAATVAVLVTPTAANDSATTPVNTPVQIPILANDVGSLIPSTVVFPTQPNGTVTNGGKKLIIPNEGVYDVNPDGTVTFTPANGFIGIVKPATYSVSDGVTTRQALIDNLIVAAQTGSLRGVVFLDLDGNGSQGATEPGIPNVDVVLTNGSFTRTVVTDANGVYTADTVPTGTVTIDVSNTDPQFPANVTQTAGVDPSVVSVTVANTPAAPANAGADGYRPAAPVAVNDSATTTADTNVDIPVLTNDSSSAPSTKDPSSVVFTPANQPIGSIRSPDGKTLTVPNEGTYTISPTGVVTFDPLPTFTGSTTPVQYTFEDSNGQPSNPAQIAVTVGAPTKGSVIGKVFEDTNGNGTQEAGELGIPNVQVTLTNGAFSTTVTTDSSGNYSALNVPVGNTTVDVVDSSLPANVKTGSTPNQTAGTDPTTVNVVAGNTATDAGVDGYRPTPPVANPDTRVALDTSTPINNIPVLTNDTSSNPLVPASVVFPTVGQPAGSTVSPNGKTLTNPSGTFTINPDGTVSFVPSPTFTGTPVTVKYTVQDTTGQTSNPTDLTVSAPGNPALGTVVGKVFRDDNGNGVQDGSEPGLENVQVQVSNGAFTSTVLTAPDGSYTVPNVPLGNTTIDVIDSSLPSNVKTGSTPNQTAGTDPSVVNVVAGSNNAGVDGYRLNPPVATNDSSSTPVNTPITFSLTGNDTATNPANVAPDTIDLDPSTPARETTRTVPEGTFTVNGIGEVTFVPNTNFSGTVTPITYTVLDSTTQKSNSATVAVIVTPTATTDTASTPVNTPVQIPVLANDVGSKDPTKVFFPSTGQPVGAVVSNGGRTLTTPEGAFISNPVTGVVTFVPTNGFTGVVPTVKYTMTDNVTTRTADLNVTVTAQVGSLRGVVFLDLDGNGSQSATEPGIPNIDVVLTNGSFTRTVVTNAQGVYTADNVSTGTVTVDVLTTDADFPANLTQTAGVDPSVVSVTVANTPSAPANAGADGYRPVAPVAVNDSATVPVGATFVNIPVLDNDSSNSPSTKDPSSVVFTPTGQPTGSTLTPDGKTLTVPNEGTYTISPTGVVTFTPVPNFTGSATPVQYTFKDSNGQPSNPAQIAVTVGAPNKGNITGRVFEDTNGNGTLEAGEPRLANVQVTITPASGSPITLLTDSNGVYTALNLPVGNATVDVVDSSIPSIYKNATGTPNQTAGTDPTTNVVVTAGTTVNQGDDGYRPNPPVANDDATVAPDTSTPVNNIPVLGNDTSSKPLVPSSVVFPSTGQPTGSTISPDGKTITVPNNGTYTINPNGTVNFVPDPAFNGTPVAVKYTVQDTTGQTSNPATLSVSAPGNPALATVVGKVYRDDNGNNTQDGSEPGLENISVTVTNGTFTATVQTAPDGSYAVPNVPLGSPVTVTVVNSTIPATLKTGNTPNQTEGTNPTTITTPVAGINNAGNDGYRLNPPVARPDTASTPLNTPVTFSLTGNDTATNPANVAPDTVDLDPSTPARETTRTVPEGTYTVNGVGEVTFVPNNNFSGTVTPITYTVLDSTTQKSNSATVGVTVLPRSSNDTATTPQETPVTVNVLNNDAGSLVPSSVVFPAVGQPAGSTISNGGKRLTVPNEGVYDINPDGSITFTPATGFFGVAKPVTYQVTDGTTPVTATLTVNVDQIKTARLEIPVFNDTNGNGVRDAGETPIAGATVTLYEVIPDPANPGKFIVKRDAAGNPVRLIDPATISPANPNGLPYPPVLTDADGIAVFPNVKVGQVGVVITDPSGKVLTTGNNIQVIDVKPNTTNTAPAVGYVPPQIALTITPDRSVVTPGDNLPYTSVITNNTPGTITPLKDPVYTVKLPVGVTYDPSKPVTVQGPNGTPVVINPNQITVSTGPDGQQILVIKLPNDLKNGEPVIVKFDTIVAPNVDPSKTLIAIGTVTGTANNPNPLNPGVPVQVNASSGAIAAAAVKINLGIFDNKSVILGRIYFDANSNNNFDDGEKPLAGARVYFSDGRTAVTDKNGNYNIPNVAPGTYAVRLDPVTAPYSVRRVPEDQGSAGTRHVRVGEVGGIIYADFSLIPPSGAAVKSRSTTVQRGPITLQKSMVQGGAGYAVTIRIVVDKPVSNLVINDPLPANSSRGPITINGTTVTPVLNGTSITIPGTVAAGTYTIVYPLFSPLPPDLVLTDPDISYEEIFVLIPLQPLENSTSAPTPVAQDATEVDSEISRKFGDEVIQ